MLFFTLKTIFISLLLIALIHYLYGFFKNTLTVPKVKDLVNKPAQRYNQMFAGINNENDYTRQERNIKQEQNVNEDRNGREINVDQQSKGQQSKGQQSKGQQSMQSELKNFLNELKKPNIVTTKSHTIDAINNSFSAANESAFGSYTPF